VANKHGKAKPQEGGKIRVRDKAEEALQHSEQEYRTTLENDEDYNLWVLLHQTTDAVLRARQKEPGAGEHNGEGTASLPQVNQEKVHPQDNIFAV
jgi:hypothetical protein